MRVTYSGLDLAAQVSNGSIDHEEADQLVRKDGRTECVKGADNVARLGAKVVLVEATLLEAVHGGCVEAGVAREWER